AAGGARTGRRTGGREAVSGGRKSRAAGACAPAVAGRGVVAGLPWLLAALVFAARGTPPPRAAPGEGAVVVVRHAEKADDGGSDPALSGAGHERAASLARSLAGRNVVAIYTTGFRRTRDTVAPTATAQGLAVTVYDAHEPAADLAA